MKKLLMIVVITFSVTQLCLQGQVQKTTENRNFRIPLIGEPAPSFTAETTTGTLNFPVDYGRAWKVLFSHPQDFTPVCTTEIMELAYLQEKFDKLGVKLVIISTGPLDAHEQWKKSMESLNINNRGLVKIKFPLVDDKNLSISKQYGMIHPASNTTKSVRGVFIIDPDDIIEAVLFYPMNVGRSTDELLRMVSALKATASEKVMTPVNWQAGNDLLVPIPPKTDAKSATPVPEGFYSPVWYVWYKKGNK